MAENERSGSVKNAIAQFESAGAGSDKETDTFEDTFEDAVDAGSIRSLTKRKTSTAHQELSDYDGAQDSEPAETPLEEKTEPQTTRNADKRASEALSAASLADVDLDNEATVESPSPPPKEEETPELEKSEPEKQASKKLSLSNITSSLPSMPWSPPPQDSPAKSPSATSTQISSAPTATSSGGPPPPPTRKLTSPFSWLSRNSGSKDSSTTPPATSPRRNTASSIATLTSNPEMMLSKLEEGDEGGDGRRPRHSLKDRFKLVRMREEAGVQLPIGDDDKTQSAIGGLVRSSTMGIMSPTIEGDKDGNLAVQPPTSPLPPSPNPSLAPGTVSGVSAGPSAMGDSQVDWDFWQSVVYEGPAAVARTSAEELSKAIATGIPNVIRGVVWQVLTQSNNEDLEVMYRELVARGTDKEKDRMSNGTSLSTSSNGNLSVEKEATISSASSVHSDHSGVNGRKSPPSVSDKDSETFQKAQAAAAAERQRRDKEDAAKLSKLEKVIRRDMGARTSYSKHAAAAGLQDGLFGVCKAYALFDEGVGYAQGMNFLVMPLLFNMPEEEAFCLLVRLMNHYKLRDLFIQDMPGLHLHLYQFERLLEDLEPALYCHLHRRGISPHLYATQWFLTLFAYRFPLQLVLRIYDLILSEGLSAILKFGIVLMQKNAATLLGMSDMSQLTNFLKDKVFDVYIDHAPSAGSILENGFFGSSSASVDKEVYRADQMVHDACEVKVTPELLKAYTAEWEEKTRAEKERETEIETLRTSNASYVIKQRRLEERIEACDREQAAMATELVHTKVENEELKDENESLKGQVKELRVVIEKQPEEIEAAWKLERDDLMKRNQNVHEENEKLEKELAELEELLVKTKMQYAEINSQHEALNRKWMDMKRQFA